MSTTALSSDYKAPGGKMLRVRLKEKDGRIESAKISGDFFRIPEESLSNVEKMLEDARLDEKELGLLVDRFFRGTKSQRLGGSPDGFDEASVPRRCGCSWV